MGVLARSRGNAHHLFLQTHDIIIDTPLIYLGVHLTKKQLQNWGELPPDDQLQEYS